MITLSFIKAAAGRFVGHSVHPEPVPGSAWDTFGRTTDVAKRLGLPMTDTPLPMPR